MTATIAILAGGQSKRMGQDKAALIIGGQTLLERTIHTAQAVAGSVLVVGRSLPEAPANIACLADDPPGAGPMGGLRAALRHAEGDVLAVACDMPNMTAGALKWLVAAADQRSLPNGLVVRNGFRLEPLFSVYGQSSLPRLEQCLQKGNFGLRAFIASGQFGQVLLPAEFDAALVNINTPEEYSASTCQI